MKPPRAALNAQIESKNGSIGGWQVLLLTLIALIHCGVLIVGIDEPDNVTVSPGNTPVPLAMVIP
jgi:hypothetical protein